MVLLLSGVLVAPSIIFAQGDISCTRGGLQRAVKLYLEAQTKGNPSLLPLAQSVEYQENMAPHLLSEGIINKPMKIDHTLSIYDEHTCQTFTEVIVTNPENPYVLGTRLRVSHDKIAELEILWTTTGYWLFNADNYLKYSQAEDWGPIPAEKRDTRGALAFAAGSYLDAFLEGKIDLVPWGFPCVRIEGGAYTGRGRPDDSCEVGVPAGVNITNRRYVIDEVLGAVVVYCTFGGSTPGGGSGAPDTHLFRVENGKLRYVHTLTHLLQASFQGGKAQLPEIR
jgi:hypothetical protein